MPASSSPMVVAAWCAAACWRRSAPNWRAWPCSSLAASSPTPPTRPWWARLNWPVPRRSTSCSLSVAVPCWMAPNLSPQLPLTIRPRIPGTFSRRSAARCVPPSPSALCWPCLPPAPRWTWGPSSLASAPATSSTSSPPSWCRALPCSTPCSPIPCRRVRWRTAWWMPSSTFWSSTSPTRSTPRCRIASPKGCYWLWSRRGPRRWPSRKTTTCAPTSCGVPPWPSTAWSAPACPMTGPPTCWVTSSPPSMAWIMPRPWR